MKISLLSALFMLILAAVAEAGRTTVSASRSTLVATKQVNEKAFFHDRRRKLSESEDEEESESESEDSEDSADEEEQQEAGMAYGAAGSAVFILSGLGLLELRRKLALKRQQEEEGSTLSYHLNHDNQGVEVV